MHPMISHHLNQLGLDGSSPPDQQRWPELLSGLSAAFDDPRMVREERFRALLNALPDLLFLLDEEGRYVEVIAGDEHHLQRPAESLKGALLTDLLPAALADRLLEAIGNTLASNALQVVEYSLSLPMGERAMEGRLVPTEIEADGRRTVLMLSRDVTDLAESRERLEHLATHDELTDLANRSLLEKRLRQAVARAKRQDNHGALMVLDIDRFKQINDSLGHQAGDRLLAKVADRLRKACRVEDTLARFGGDEYVVVVEDLPNLAAADRAARNLLDTFAEPLHLGGFELDVSASIGIAIFPDDGDSVDLLLRQADNAMYAAKEAGRSQYAFYTAELGNDAMAYLAMEAELRKAIANDELALLYQPQFRMRDEALVGLEALVRWPGAQDPEYSMPSQFIPVAEMSGLIEPLGMWVLEEACTQAARWLRAGFDFGRIGVNLSSRQLNNPRLAEQVRETLARHGLEGGILELEITESMVVHEGGVPYSNIHELHAMGVELAIDDFGTGHSSLVNLKRFPLTRLKIDRSFVDGLGEDSNDEAIASASIALAKLLGLEVVAEGVETEQQLQFLQRHRCDMVQGFYYAKPLSVADVETRFGPASTSQLPEASGAA